MSDLHSLTNEQMATLEPVFSGLHPENSFVSGACASSQRSPSCGSPAKLKRHRYRRELINSMATFFGEVSMRSATLLLLSEGHCLDRDARPAL